MPRAATSGRSTGSWTGCGRSTPRATPSRAVALPLVRAAAAFAAGDHAETLALLEPIEGEIHRMGGSHAQWELFEETMVVSYLRQGRSERTRRGCSGAGSPARASARDARWLAQAETASGAV